VQALPASYAVCCQWASKACTPVWLIAQLILSPLLLCNCFCIPCPD